MPSTPNPVNQINLVTYTGIDDTSYIKGSPGSTYINMNTNIFYKYVSDYVWTQYPMNADWNATDGFAKMINKPDLTVFVNKVVGKDLSTNDYTTIEKNKLASLSNADLSNLVVKVTGKQLSTEDYSTVEKSKLASLSNPDLSIYVNKVVGKDLSTNDYSNDDKNKLAGLSNADLSNLVVKVTGKQLSTEDYSTVEKTKLAGLSAQVASDWAATTGVSAILNKPVLDKTIVGTVAKPNSFRIYKNATVASGVAVFYLTDDGTATGNALYNEVFTDSIQLIVNDATSSYQFGWVFSNTNKTLTVTTNKLSTANVLTGVLGQVAANGAIVKLCIEGK